MTGCQHAADYCTPATTHGAWDEATGTFATCPLSCPVECAMDQMWCPGSWDEVTGCEGPAWCAPMEAGCGSP